MVLEGVHLVPGMLPRMVENALVVDCVVAIENEETHAGHFWIRDIALGGRPARSTSTSSASATSAISRTTSSSARRWRRSR